MKKEQKARLRALLALGLRTSEEESELSTLQAMATEAGIDITAEIAGESATALRARLDALEAQVKDAEAATARAKADADAAEAKAKDPAEMLKRITALETLVRSGIAAGAGGTSPITGQQAGEGDGPRSMKRADWEKLRGTERAKFIREGGKLSD